MSAFKEDLPDWLLTQPVAHRGLHNNSAGLPENSLASIAACVRAGCPVEIDVRLLADGNIIVFHDRTMDRLTHCHGPIEHLEMNSIQGATLLGTHERIPLLSEALAAIDGRVPLLLEIKCEMPPVSPITEAAARELKHYNGLYAVQSFNPFVVRLMHRLLPGIPLGLLSGWKFGTSLVWLSKADVLCQEVSRLEDASVQRARRRGLPVLAWVVRDEQTLSKAVRLADNYIYESIKLAKLERSSAS